MFGTHSPRSIGPNKHLHKAISRDDGGISSPPQKHMGYQWLTRAAVKSHSILMTQAPLDRWP